MSWVLLSLGVYTFVYCVVLLFLENFSGRTLFGMDKQVIAALIGAGVSVAAILGSVIHRRATEVDRGFFTRPSPRWRNTTPLSLVTGITFI